MFEPNTGTLVLAEASAAPSSHKGCMSRTRPATLSYDVCLHEYSHFLLLILYGTLVQPAQLELEHSVLIRYLISTINTTNDAKSITLKLVVEQK